MLGLLFSLPLPLIILMWLPSVLCGIHVVRSGRELTWVWFFVIGPIIAPAIYALAVLLPSAMGGKTARSLGKAATKALDPEREYRAAKNALNDAETVGNHMRFAQAAASLGRWTEAEAAWRETVVGQFADDPVVILGHANALLALERYDEALSRLEALPPSDAETGPGALAYARAFEGLGRSEEADPPYRFAADRLPGLEAACRYCAFLAKTGKREAALTAFGEIERRYLKINPSLRSREKPWRDLAARAVGK